MKEIETKPDRKGASILLQQRNAGRSSSARRYPADGANGKSGVIHPAGVMLEEIRTTRSSQI